MTELIFIIDKSGSMYSLAEDTIGGFNSMLESERGKEGECLVSTVFFSGGSKVIHDRVPIKDVKPLTGEDYVTGGCTALLDAVGDAVHHIRNVHKYARPEDRPERTLVMITTDGLENASFRWDYDKVKSEIKRAEENGWEFIFLGANIDAAKEAGRMGIRRERAVNYTADKEGTALNYDAVRMAVRSVRVGDNIDSSGWRRKVDKNFEKKTRT